MKNYEALYIFDTRGQDEVANEIVEKIEAEIKQLGGKVKGVQKLERRKFERGQAALDSGFYVNVLFQLASNELKTLRSKLTLNTQIFRQLYLVTTAKAKTEKRSVTTKAQTVMA